MVVRRTSLNLDFELVERAKAELGTNGTTDTITRALEDVVRRAALERLGRRRFPDLEGDGLDRLRSGFGR
jgi:hypothetical protein